MQLTVISGLSAILFYLIGTLFQWQNFASNKDTRSQVFSFGVLAVIAHAISAYGVIITPSGYHFGVFEISTLIALAISFVVLVSNLKKPLGILFLGLYPLAIITIGASLAFRSDYPPTSMNIGLASHVFLSILAYSFITIAALQAGFLAYQNHQLKHAHASGILSRFPPLQDMEAFLFELLWIGQLLLSLGIVAGLFFIDNFWGLDGVPHKTIFSILAWIVFAVLLWGRHQLGWRGQTAIRGTLGGFILLILGFYGTKFVLEFILR
ncbi:MAG: phosphohydrolase [SAR86 cluster bacterium]|uniref:Phosphohydrolase n=1 Tax=SAR86 cluster bacterium TaxID=2030880 RepID=A0A2A5AWH7_9GAMM|nr:MAG: phosphohydrolase [SAR86 cluster bacterium]